MDQKNQKAQKYSNYLVYLIHLTNNHMKHLFFEIYSLLLVLHFYLDAISMPFYDIAF